MKAPYGALIQIIEPRLIALGFGPFIDEEYRRAYENGIFCIEFSADRNEIGLSKSVYHKPQMKKSILPTEVLMPVLDPAAYEEI